MSSPLDDEYAQALALLESNPAAAAKMAQRLVHLSADNAHYYRLMARALDQLGLAPQAEKARRAARSSARHCAAIQAAKKALRTAEPLRAVTVLQDHLAIHSDDEAAREALQHAAGAALQDYLQSFALSDGLAFANNLPADIQVAPAIMELRAIMLAEVGRHGDALRLRQQLAQQHSSPTAALAAGDQLRIMGRTDEAAAQYRIALTLDPADGRSWWSLCNLVSGAITPREEANLRSICAAKADHPVNEYLAFALGRVHEHCHQPAQAWAAYRTGNRLRAAQLGFDLAQYQASLIQPEADFFAARHGWGEPSDAPIFIVGMPRSGSTLLEQMLAGHPDITAGGELPIMAVLAREAAAQRGLSAAGRLPALLAQLTREECAELGREYLARARQVVGDRRHFTDKMPHNWALLPLIRLILPNAQVIDLRRAKADCCVSNFTMLFNPGHPASYDLANMSGYYRLYQEWMARFNAVQAGAVQQLSYEELVQDAEGQLRALLAAMRMEFAPACLDHTSRTGAVATASAEQVRRPLTASSIGSWQRFAPFMSEEEAALLT